MRSRTLRALRWVAVFTLGTAPLDAQVGHDPAGSPYGDMRIKQTLTLLGGYISGGQGRVGVGPSNGPLGGLRWDVHLGGAAAFFLGVARSDLERDLLEPLAPPEDRFAGTADQRLYLVDAGINLLITGRKTWHGLMPYVGASMGAVLSEEVPQDSSGFRFGTKFQIGPSIGTRLFLNRRLHLRFEARDTLWKVSYPDVFFQDPDPDDPTVLPVLDPLFNKRSEWTHHLTLVVGIGYTLRL